MTIPGRVFVSSFVAVLLTASLIQAKGPRIVDPKQVDADYAIQGEYSGTLENLVYALWEDASSRQRRCPVIGEICREAFVPVGKTGATTPPPLRARQWCVCSSCGHYSANLAHSGGSFSCRFRALSGFRWLVR